MLLDLTSIGPAVDIEAPPGSDHPELASRISDNSGISTNCRRAYELSIQYRRLTLTGNDKTTASFVFPPSMAALDATTSPFKACGY